MRYLLLLPGVLIAIVTSVNANTSLKPSIAQPTACVNSLFYSNGKSTLEINRIKVNQ